MSNKNTDIRKWEKQTGIKKGLGVTGCLSITLNNRGNLVCGVQAINLSGRDAMIMEFKLDEGEPLASGTNLDWLFDQTEHSSFFDYHLGISGIAYSNSNELYFSVGRDTQQDGTDFRDENVIKDRVVFSKQTLKLKFLQVKHQV